MMLEYECCESLNLYDRPDLESLATQARAGRHLKILQEQETALYVTLCEDDYPGWIARSATIHLKQATTPYQAPVFSAPEIQARIPAVIDFALAAQQPPNEYLWGGTLGPNYDCSGLVQAAFLSQGIWLPRDSYQQQDFTHPIQCHAENPTAFLQPGDLIFFGNPQRTTHVAIYLGDGNYLHSSGMQQGRNGIGIDSLVDLSHPVSQTYFQQLRGAGRVMASYRPKTQKPS